MSQIHPESFTVDDICDCDFCVRVRNRQNERLAMNSSLPIEYEQKYGVAKACTQPAPLPIRTQPIPLFTCIKIAIYDWLTR